MTSATLEFGLRNVRVLLLSFAVAATVTVKPSAAQELTVQAVVEVGFGRVNLESEGTKGLDGIGEATINLSGTKDRFSAQVEIVVGESENQFDSAEHELVWKATDFLAITISGSAIEMEATEGNISVVNAPSGPVGDQEANLDFSGAGLLNVVFSGGALKFGVAFLDVCVPQCGYGLDSGEPEPSRPDSNLMTGVVHFQADGDSFNFNIYIARSSGTFAASAVEGEGQGGGLGVVYEEGAFRTALDLSAATIKCAANAGDTTCRDDKEQTSYGLSLNVAGFGFHYYFANDQSGADETETTNVDLVYLIEVGDAVVGPEFRSHRIVPSGGRPTTDSLYLFGMSIEF